MKKFELLKKFGKNVKIERIKKDLIQEELAEKLGVSQNYIANAESKICLWTKFWN